MDKTCDITRASELLNVKEKSLHIFEVVDTFNDGNILSGFICNERTHLYGSLVITSVNDDVREQVVYGTPKMHYPFDRDGKFNWPPVNEIQAWEKFDGTNILAYHHLQKK